MRNHTCAVYSIAMAKCPVICTHHYSTMLVLLTTLKILNVLPIHPSLLSDPWATTDLFLVSIVLPYSECHDHIFF